MTDPAHDDIDWPRLQDAARAMLDHSYSPYSGVRVGAAALVDDGRVIVGSNVENASYGLSLCAECSLVGDLARTGGGQLIAFTVVGGDGTYLAPCGRCRQLLYEFGGTDLLIDVGDRIVTLAELLPGAFGPEDLPPHGSSPPPPVVDEETSDGTDENAPATSPSVDGGSATNGGAPR